jgi:hypothetical protein
MPTEETRGVADNSDEVVELKTSYGLEYLGAVKRRSEVY